MSSFSVSSIIEKSENRDKDLRHMALYDLHTELQKENVKLDENSQRQLADVVLRLLDDKHSDVQGMAVKCMGPLVTKMSKFQVENSVSKLSHNLLNGDDEKRDIATIALKTVISKPPISIAIGPVKKALPLLVKALEQDVPEVKLDALDVLNDILKRFGNLITASHQILQTAFMNELANPRPAVRKRAISALSLLSTHTSMDLFKTLTDNVIFNIRASLEKGGVELRTYVQLTSQIARNSGHRLGNQMNDFVDLLLKAAENISEWEEEDEGENDEIREYIMQALEAFVLKCQAEVTPFVELILILGNEYMEYDPNFSYEDSDDEEGGEGMEDEEDEEDDDEDDEFGGMDDDADEADELDEDEDYSDEGDITWKVRKAAARCIHALIKTKPDQLDLLYRYLCSTEDHILISRFKERDESAKLENFKVFMSLLNQTITQTTTSKGEILITQQPEVKYLKESTKMIMTRLLKQLKNKSVRVKQSVFSVLKDLVLTMQGGLEGFIDTIIKETKDILESSDQNSALKLVALQFLDVVLKNHSPTIFTPSLDLLLTSVYERIGDKYYKITSEALKVCSSLVPVIKGMKDVGKAKVLYDNVFEKLKIQDIDQDVKENAIHSMGVILSAFGNELKKELKQCLPLLLNRLKNETTRLITCKSIGDIAEAKVDLSSVINDIITELSSFLRKKNRSLRQSALSSLTVIAQTYQKNIGNNVIVEISKLVSDQDLHLAHLSLNLASEIMKNNTSVLGDVQSGVLPKILELLGSSTLQGSALVSSVNVIKGLVPKVGYDKMMQTVLSAMKGSDIPKQIYINIAYAVSSLIEIGNEKEQKHTIDKFRKDLDSKDVNVKMLALFSIGEIGRKIDISDNAKIMEQIQMNFDDKSEEVKNAASYALGNASIGNLEKYLPEILSQIREESKKKYLLIHSLKEVIIRAEPEKLKPYSDKVIPLLFEHASSKEEGVRNVVSECLGKMCLVFYEQVMPNLKKVLEEEKSSKGKACVISAVKYVITEKPTPIDEMLKQDIMKFLGKLDKKEKVHVRRSAVVLLTSIAHNKPSLIVTQLSKFLPNLYAECVFDPSLERVINLGPFKHKVDDGLELRKSSFECLDTLLSSVRKHVNALDFVKNLELGINDRNNDIKMLTHIIAAKCAKYFPNELITVVPKCCVPMSKLLKKKIRESALQKDKERHEEIVKSTLKVIYAWSKVKGMADVLQFTDIIEKQIPNTQKLKNYFQQLKSEDEEDFEVM